MSAEELDNGGQDDQVTNYTFGQTSPLGLTDYKGCDHQGRVKLAFDESTLPSDAGDDVADDMNWAIQAVNAVVHYPNLALWVRTPRRDLIIAHDPADAHERAGHVRAATFARNDRVEGNLTTDTEIDCGLITPFDAVNVLYDYIVGESYNLGTSVVLTDIAYLDGYVSSFHHPIIDIDDGVAEWGRHHLVKRAFPRPDGRERTAYPEAAYLESVTDSQHAHATTVLSEHIEAFAFPQDEGNTDE